MLDVFTGGTKKSGADFEVVVLRDSHAAAEAIREALATAGAEERPGLERAAALIARHAARPEREVRAEWVRGILAEAGVDARSQELHAIKALRKAERGLSLATAVRLVREAADVAAEPGRSVPSGI
ncbi:hypothetical protein IPZ58_24370 [Streptomyces roseoverticillatus]|uniref:hypothetical protein n=1 Tax=Streptomyces roseoverticillatus TaxID=66429 RepID=UPI001F43AD5C|nr:hypothetical protein [Streptomyces roseoverticillatus]MCF3104702.1 hypothetical protein [Streptomyces roseoverticillatus]